MQVQSSGSVEEPGIFVVQSPNHVPLFLTLWTVAHQSPLSMGFSRQEYWSGLPCCPPGDLPSPGIKPRSPAFQVDSLPSEPPEHIGRMVKNFQELGFRKSEWVSQGRVWEPGCEETCVI